MVTFYYVEENNKLYWKTRDDIGDLFLETHVEIEEYDNVNNYSTYEELMEDFPNCAIGRYENSVLGHRRIR